MNTQKLKVALIFGGRSAEHEVSLQSAKNVLESMDTSKYEITLIGIDREGRWYLNESSFFLLNTDNPKMISMKSNENRIALTPDGIDGELVNKKTNEHIGKIDIIFPVLHGLYGEDGSIQGLAKLANLPCVGPDILGSAVSMDKDVMKRLLRDSGLKISPFRAYSSELDAINDYNDLTKEIGNDVFVKPANSGSSVGISHVQSWNQYEKAVKNAFKYDTKIITEKTIKGREIEIAVLGNNDPEASIPGEIIPAKDFYSYEAKYIDENGARLQIPAQLEKSLCEKMQTQAILAYKSLCLRGMARVDFFLEQEDKIIINEVNTIPGFTKISMYPKLWEASGIPYGTLIDRLISLAMSEFKLKEALRTKPDQIF